MTFRPGLCQILTASIQLTSFVGCMTDLDETSNEPTRGEDAGNGAAAADGAAANAAGAEPEVGADGVPVPDAAEEASFFARQEGPQGLEQPLAYAMRIFERVFTTDIQRLLGMTVRPQSQVWHVGSCLCAAV